MFLAKYKVQPNDVRIYSVDCSQWLNDGEILEKPNNTGLPVDIIVSGDSSGTFVARDLDVDATSTGFSFYAGGGAHGDRVVLTLIMHTSLRQRKEDELLFMVRDIK